MKLGLIAGNRKYPVIFAEEAKRQGVYLVVAAFNGETDKRLKRYADEMSWFDVGQLEKLIDFFKKNGIREAVMIGQITPFRLFRKIRLDKRAEGILKSVKQMSAESIFGPIADEFEKEGITLKDARLFLENCLAVKGPITDTVPDEKEAVDIDFGKEAAKKLAELDIGQTIAVKNKTVVAVEAIEGTDYTIRRAGRIARGGITVVKVSKPGQDMRFDVPVVGPSTVKTLKRAGGGVLALESGNVIILEKEKTLKMARKYGIKMFGI